MEMMCIDQCIGGEAGGASGGAAKTTKRVMVSDSKLGSQVLLVSYEYVNNHRDLKLLGLL